jgi:uncharacterized protein YciI
MVRSIVAAVVLASGTFTGFAGFAAWAQQRAPAPAAQAGSPQIAIPARWLVTFELGPKFDATKRLQEQAGFMEHVTAIRKLADDGALMIGGPLLESFESHKPTGAAWIVDAPNEEAVKKLAATDPWVTGELAKVQSVRAFFAGTGVWLTGPKPAEKPAEKPASGDAKGH